MTDEQRIQRIKQTLKTYPDFPKKGILFYDIFSLLASPTTTNDLLALLEARVRSLCPDVDVFVGLEARGFLFGLPLARAFAKPFVPVRKKGKLPGEVKKVYFKLEYGEDIFEMQSDSIKEGQKVVILDDLLATGGTLRAANELMASAKATVALNLVCFELEELKGRNKVSTPVESLLLL